MFYRDEDLPGIPLFVTKDSFLWDVYKKVFNSKTIKTIKPKYFLPKTNIQIRKKVTLLRK